MERIEIGRVCEKSGGHAYYIGNSDYGVCGSHEFATIYAAIEIDRPNPRGTTYSLEAVADAIMRMSKATEAHAWCGVE